MSAGLKGGDTGRHTTAAVRSATLRDLDPLTELERAAFGAGAWSADQLAGTLRSPGMLVLLARPATETGDAAAPLAYAIFQRAADEAELLRIGVDPPYRRRGLATRLIDSGLARLRERGVERCFLEVAAGNRAAIALYEQLGFSRRGYRRGYYPNGDDALLLAKKL